MRNQGQNEAWSNYVTTARDFIRMSRPELAKALGVGRTTIWRWENGEQTPENAQVVVRFAEVTGVDLDEALAAAGLRPGAAPPAEPRTQTPPMDPEVAELNRRLQDPDISPEEKNAIRVLIRYATARVEWEPPAAESKRRRAAS